MEKAKLCISVNFKGSSDPNNLKALQSLVKSFAGTQVDYLALDLYSCAVVNVNTCDEIDSFCREKSISWFPLVTSIEAVNLTRPYYSSLPDGRLGYMVGIPSSSIKDSLLLGYARESSDYLVLYTGGCTQKEIDRGIEEAQPDLVIHHSTGETRLDYIKYLQGISIEFEKKYSVGFKNISTESVSLLIAAHMLGATFLEFTLDAAIEVTDRILDHSKVVTEYSQLVNDLLKIDNSRGGYEARKLSKLEKEIEKR